MKRQQMVLKKSTVVETKTDGTVKETVKTTGKNKYGKETVSTVVTNKDAAGKVTGITEKTVINVTKMLQLQLR